MAARSAAPEKRPGFFSQLKTLFTFTRDVYSWLPWVLIAILVVGIAVGVGIGSLIPPAQIWSVILWGITGLMLGVLASMILMTRLATRAMYKKIDGMPGASGHVLSTGLPRSWTASDEPVQVNAKTQEAVYRAVGKAGIVLVGEGHRARLTRLVNEERMKARRVASGVPVTVLYVGDGPEDVTIAQLAKTIKAMPKKIDRATRAAVIQRLASMNSGLGSLPIPKGIDPTKVRAPRPR
ncbi:DUF4191 domain-containing protein [Microbacterium gorillae]|uniref:DUF4191 domain-containing protein n=1 Tax=Microbacterium gorillae TaxID=1231063 RepID=UPI00058E171E|nr:DUF4191 domain-containing protein [Microbacterium gorillae]